MKHAGPAALERLASLLEGIRALPLTRAKIKEKTPGIFYRSGSAYLHFHEHGDQLFADAKFDGQAFERMEVTHPDQHVALLARLKEI